MEIQKHVSAGEEVDDGSKDGVLLILGVCDADGNSVGDGLILGYGINGMVKLVLSVKYTPSSSIRTAFSNSPPSTITAPLDVTL